jgi:hypothetical protein
VALHWRTVLHVQFEHFNVRMFQLLDLSSEQKTACADLWRRWLQTRQMLHDRQAALAHSLHTMLPGLPDISSTFLATLRAPNALHSSERDEQWSLAQYSPLGQGCGHQWTRHLIGVSPSATTVAGALVVQLRQLLLDDALHSWDFTAGADGFWYQLSPQQLQLLETSKTTDADVCLFDHFKLAQLAASEQRMRSVTCRMFLQT